MQTGSSSPESEREREGGFPQHCHAENLFARDAGDYTRDSLQCKPCAFSTEVTPFSTFCTEKVGQCRSLYFPKHCRFFLASSNLDIASLQTVPLFYKCNLVQHQASQYLFRGADSQVSVRRTATLVLFSHHRFVFPAMCCWSIVWASQTGS